MSAGRLLELSEAYLDDDLTDGEARELRALVTGDAASRDRFLSEVRWHIRLADRLRAPGLPLIERIEARLAADGQGPRVADAVAARIASRSFRRNRTSSRFRRRRRSSSAPWWVAAAAGLLLAFTLLAGLPGGAAPAATVRGAGTVERAGLALIIGSRPQALADGDILVADGAGLEVRYGDGTGIELASDGRLTLDSGAGTGAKHLVLARGALLARVAKQPAGEPLRIVTPQARVTILGTTFRLRIEEAGTRLTVEEGRIAFARRNEGVGIEVATGRSAFAGSDGTLALEPLTPPVARRRAWIAQPFGPTSGRPFSDASPYNHPIPERPVLDADSPAIASRLAALPATVALFKNALPVYEADASTPLRTVTVLKNSERSSLTGATIRVPQDAQPNSGGNRALVVLDREARRAWELFHFSWDGDGIRIDGGGSVPFDGDGVPNPPSGYAGGSYLAGLIRVHEVASGHIPHALAFGCSSARKGVWRHPARQTDGRTAGSDTIPVGARIQLDPALDLDAIPGLTPGERTIAEALQTYGAFCVGASAEPFVFFCELAPDATGIGQPGAAYTAAGFTADNALLDRIPFGSLRVLSAWDGNADDR